MKMNLLLIVSIAYMVLSSCGDSDESVLPDNKPDIIDETLDYREPFATTAAYQTFYKPVNADVGDPMPYYDETDQMFYIYFLIGNFSGYSRGGIYLTKTKDFAKFQNTASTQILVGNDGDRDEGIGTGCCIKKDNAFHFFYTGFNDGMYKQMVTKATTNDLTKTWYKVKSLAVNAPTGYEKNEFRDPCVYWDDTRNKYVMLVGSSSSGKAAIARFQSDDLTQWESIEGIKAVAENPQKFEMETDTKITECPDIFKMGNKWYLVFSRINRDEHRKTFYRMADNPDGPWKICGDRAQNNHHETFDGLWLYAAKTVSDGTTRYLSGWASAGQERQASNGELSWGGMLVTHKLVQQTDGKLYPVIPDAVDAKFSKEVTYKDIKTDGNVSGNSDSFTVSNGKVVFNRNASSVKIQLKIDAVQATKDFGIAFGAHNNQADAYHITFDLTSDNRYGQPSLFLYHKGKELNFTPLIVAGNKQYEVTIIIERQVCTMYVNDNVAFTNHISNMEQNPWMIFSNEGIAKFNNIKIYRLPN
ncbi:glycoside hydrolase family 32 protein [Bacteroides graminisolvens]|jgi:beta-fructofuranosidase|uniref:glycoside hydrolase family 32 protein n=1 Tax=Bacteroides graminisolvens TaxID=477666 RepID=UPI0023F0230F|nr:glycoside hydrolase family 32 protein [Bacteroides graminisolvens]MDD3211746.1 glycoside hydrolase family 32 protein [Bacteroides graminisolvens]MDD4417416.1 glycoside hydrolase family 32 protein [Bacteroides graminisolvens]